MVRVFCSLECKNSYGVADEIGVVLPPPRRRRNAVIIGLLSGSIALVAWRITDDPTSDTPIASDLGRRVDATTPASDQQEPAATALETPAADLSPNEMYWTADLASDYWLHPLAGPARRMPVRDSRVFGAERPGERPPECYRGHCGVDIGGEVWGEPVLAVHAGVVDRVVRGPNRDHGGQYVRIAHRGGTVFTQYFHLAAIPRHIRVGEPVEAGHVIGLIGQTGVSNSGPHLHFTISVKPGPDEPEQFIDPEPLIALWPVSIPVFSDTLSIPSTHIAPGKPRRGAPKKKKKRRRRRAKKKPAPVAPQPAPEAVSPSPPVGPATEEL